MIHLKGITYTIAERELLKNLEWIIPDGKRVALIGANGTGKTTLLRIINGELEANDGSILKPNSFKIGYLPQEEIRLEQNTILRYVLKGKSDLLELEQMLETLRTDLSRSDSDTLEVGEKLAGLEHQYEHWGGYKLESDAKAILSGLGFKVQEFERQIDELSGGWRMRVYLARLLLQRPDLLLLDEPTNHLDLSSLEWLEEYLDDFAGSMVIVSHDRYFIDQTANEICELAFGQMKHYAGNYHFYEQQKEKDRELLAKKSEQLEKEKKKQQDFIDRFRYKNTKATQVQSRVKMLEKMGDIELEAADQQLNFQLTVNTPSYKDVLKIKDLSFRYTNDWVLSDINLDIYRGQKIALVGDNGAGKTTLTRLIVDQLVPQKGQAIVGNRVSIGYYAQHQVDALDINSNIYDEISHAVASSQIPHIRNILGLFGLRGDDVFKKIGVLSGGEKARVSLTKILMSPANFLIMDEPTNHLDIRSKKALENALIKYDGTLVLISHDRYFLDKIVHRVIELREGQLFAYEGNYSDYLSRKRTIKQTVVVPDSDIANKGNKKSKEEKRKEALARQAISKKRKEISDFIQKVELTIEQLELRRDELEQLLADPATYKQEDAAASLNKEYVQIKLEIEELLPQWADAGEKLEELMRELDSD